MCCQDPLDFSLWILKVAARCCGKEMRALIYLLRGLIGIIYDFAEATLLATDVLFKDMDDAVVLIVAIVVMLIFFICAMITLAVLWGLAGQDNLDDDVRRVRYNRYFLAFKLTNIIFAGILTAGAVYKWEEFDIENLFKEPDAAKIFLVVSLGVDILFDPFELLIATCIHCRS